jgi:acyl carrier protein
VAEAAVVLRGGDADVRLVGYVVPSGRAPAPAALREHLAQTLPAVMVPAVWVVLDRLPLTPNGKLDRAALPDPGRPPAAAQPSADSRGVDDVAEVVRTIWQEVLLIDDIGLDEDLFDLGAHSLTITRINGRIQQQLGVDLPLDVYFDTPTIAEVAAAIRQRVSAGR